MKREAYRHPKMLDLAARLGVTRPHAIGIVTLLLDYCADAAPQGNIGKWPNGVIAAACEWSGDPTALMLSLMASGWLDPCPTYRLVIHDLEQHAERWWHLKLQKLGLSFVHSSVERPIDRTTEASILLCSSLPSSSQTSALLRKGAATAAVSLPTETVPTLDAPTTPAAPQEPPTKPRRKARQSPPAETAAIPAVLAGQPFADAWAEWLAYRRRKRWPCDADWASKQLAMLAEWGQADAIAALRNSMAQAYQGVFFPKDRPNGKPIPKPGPGQQFGVGNVAW